MSASRALFLQVNVLKNGGGHPSSTRPLALCLLSARPVRMLHHTQPTNSAKWQYPDDVSEEKSIKMKTALARSGRDAQTGGLGRVTFSTFNTTTIISPSSSLCLHPLSVSRRHLFSSGTSTNDGHRSTEALTYEQKKRLFIQAAVPMVGFGFMDNLVMITMGELIDATLGVTFGLSTLTAAGFGQIFSDVSGVCFGGTVEALFLRMGLPTAQISPEQARSRVTKVVTTFGAACGVVVGCLLGMSTLLLQNRQETEGRKHDAEFQKLLESENKAELKEYMAKLRKELNQAERTLRNSESALVQLAPLVQSDHQAAIAEEALKRLRTFRSTAERPHDWGASEAADQAADKALAFLKTRNSIALGQLPPFPPLPAEREGPAPPPPKPDYPPPKRSN